MPRARRKQKTPDEEIGEWLWFLSIRDDGFYLVNERRFLTRELAEQHGQKVRRKVHVKPHLKGQVHEEIIHVTAYDPQPMTFRQIQNFMRATAWQQGRNAL